jgi:NADPH:quinone reductase-like Zn-dependent oxidoreductase
LAPKLVNLSFEQAAAVPVSGMTALSGLRGGWFASFLFH